MADSSLNSCYFSQRDVLLTRTHHCDASDADLIIRQHVLRVNVINDFQQRLALQLTLCHELGVRHGRSVEGVSNRADLKLLHEERGSFIRAHLFHCIRARRARTAKSVGRARRANARGPDPQGAHTARTVWEPSAAFRHIGPTKQCTVAVRVDFRRPVPARNSLPRCQSQRWPHGLRSCVAQTRCVSPISRAFGTPRVRHALAVQKKACLFQAVHGAPMRHAYPTWPDHATMKRGFPGKPACSPQYHIRSMVQYRILSKWNSQDLCDRSCSKIRQ